MARLPARMWIPVSLSVLLTSCESLLDGDGCLADSLCEVDPSGLMQITSIRSNAAMGLFRAAQVPQNTSEEPTDIEQHLAERLESKTSEKENKASNRKQWPGTSVNDTKLNSTGEETAPFVHAEYQGAKGKTVEVKVEIATANEIVSIYLLLFVPLVMGWVYYWSTGCEQDVLYQQLIQLSVGATSIGNVIANQSLCILTREPMALTFLQAAGLCVAGLVVSACQVCMAKPNVQHSAEHAIAGLCKWTPAAVAFCAYQVADHFLSNNSSISERTIVGNLGPVVGFIVEVTMPSMFALSVSKKSTASLSSKMALFCTVFGATIFVLQDPDFNWIGIETSSIWTLSHVLYRLLQRALLGRLDDLPVSWMMAWDGFLLCIPAVFMSGESAASIWSGWQIWVSNSQVLILLLLSTLSFASGHFVTICCLKSCSATLTMVIANIATTLCLVQGILFFGDRDFQQPLTVVGMMINLFGGLWYAKSQDTVTCDFKGKEAEVQDANVVESS
ncbi:tal [Symbiodinium natans]|uniref:Tal protein n=1 Tax=Symbiodinium natans TaxID=878477 RepID=A0A812IN31_9DINO|nr:tal [Symbiodinium natans]